MPLIAMFSFEYRDILFEGYLGILHSAEPVSPSCRRTDRQRYFFRILAGDRG